MNWVQNISAFIPLCISIMVGVLFASIIIGQIFRFRFFRPFGKIIAVICCPGVVLHETAHCLFIKLGGGTINQVKFFTLSDPEAIGKVDSMHPEELLSNILIGIGPILVNGLVVSLLVYFLPYLHEGFTYYLIFALTVGALPSDVDLKNIFSCFHTNGSRAFLELLSLFIAIIPAWLITTWNVNSVYEINWLVFIALYFITLIGLVGFYKIVNVNRY